MLLSEVTGALATGGEAAPLTQGAHESMGRQELSHVAVGTRTALAFGRSSLLVE